jgi:hypothetical protein
MPHNKVMTMNPVEKRVSERVNIEIPVYLGQEELVTRDVSRAGIYFLSEDLYAKGKTLNFLLAFDYALSGKLLKFSCLGEVVRVEPQDRKFGIAAKIKDLKFIH